MVVVGGKETSGDASKREGDGPRHSTTMEEAARERASEQLGRRNGYEEAERERQTERKKQMDIEKSQSEISHLVPAF